MFMSIANAAYVAGEAINSGSHVYFGADGRVYRVPRPGEERLEKVRERLEIARELQGQDSDH
jgi:hypothetical protein